MKCQKNKLNLKIGNYIRTKCGKIRKIISLYDTGDVYVETHSCISKENIISSSNNVIDLIEVGDYVNGYKVVDIGDLTCYSDEIGSKYIELDFNIENDKLHWCEFTEIQEPDIKSVVTKEQFESVAYEV